MEQVYVQEQVVEVELRHLDWIRARVVFVGRLGLGVRIESTSAVMYRSWCQVRLLQTGDVK